MSATIIMWARSLSSLRSSGPNGQGSEFILDTGAAKHIVKCRAFLRDVKRNYTYRVAGVGGDARCDGVGRLDASFPAHRITAHRVPMGDTVVRLRGDPRKPPNVKKVKAFTTLEAAKEASTHRA